MSRSDDAPINRRTVLRTGALLGLGAGALLGTGAAEAGTPSTGGIPRTDPTGAYGDAPSREVALRSGQPATASGLYVDQSPGLTPASTAFDPKARPEQGVNVTRRLSFRNNYGPRIQFVIAYYSPVTCSAWGQWGTRGWWILDAGQSALVLITDVRTAYFFAEAADGAFWAGSDPTMFAPGFAFDSCIWSQRIGDRHLGLRGVDISAENYTVNLVP
ncbi:DUF1036 domain-containing protein [Micromonospora sp. NBC_01699]|uniref:DUF1036 domain-containing protein n=1 Tax=Micromonospora sp. NBC_01699 TaxID=2975984 RepID=UPI002E2A7693|nr:DUF1036 domain-containing protein [Micromonospora sp. NBC_01699]